MTPQELKSRRRALGLSQAQLARKLGCTADAVKHWERERRRIPPMLELAVQLLEREQGVRA